MVLYRCDGCGAEIPRQALRYTVAIDVRAAYDEIEVHLADLIRDHRAEILALLERMRQRDPQEVEDQVYKRFQFDLCPACHRAYLRDPLRFHVGSAALAEDIDIDGFLRSLGFGQTREEP
ncbi:MAG TPA: hypothetical protein PKI11_01920 [Candidatus Hydrogenedentes bacterium]|nr:hypothetical protein [Candidatus Hydrogenedentota bacterium]